MKKEVIIKINDKEYIFPLGLKFIGNCLNNLDLSINELAENIDKNAFYWSPIIMYQSLKSGSDNLEITQDEFLELLDNEQDYIQKIGNFNRAFVTSLNPNLPEEKPKKKVIRKKK